LQQCLVKLEREAWAATYLRIDQLSLEVHPLYTFYFDVQTVAGTSLRDQTANCNAVITSYGTTHRALASDQENFSFSTLKRASLGSRAAKPFFSYRTYLK
jgi:hypothetical protein